MAIRTRRGEGGKDSTLDVAKAIAGYADLTSPVFIRAYFSRLFISNAGGGQDGEAQGTGSVLETLLSLILSEKAGINVSENAASSKPLEEFIQQFTARGASGNGEPSKKASAAAEKTAARSS